MKNILLYRSMGKYSVTARKHDGEMAVALLCVKSDRMSLASGSTCSSSRSISFVIRGDVGIVARAIEEADALTKGCKLVSGAIRRVDVTVITLFTLATIIVDGLG